jgi:anti-sigma factor (TIGR02949 family)
VIRLLRRMKKLLGPRPKRRGAMSCEEALENLFEHLDSELDAETAQQVEQHIEICKRCYSRAQFERAFLDAVAASDREGRPVPKGLHERVLSVIEDENWGTER